MKKLFVLCALFGCSDAENGARITAPATTPVKTASKDCLGAQHKNLAVLMGASTENAVQFNVLAPRHAAVDAAIVAADGTRQGASRTSQSFADDQPCKVVHVAFDGLLPDSDYTLSLEVASDEQTLDETRRFRTQSPDAERFRVAFGTCMNDEPAYHAVQKNIYQALTDQRPDLFIIGGDTVYVDAWAFWPDGYLPGKNVLAGDLWRRYTESWLTLDLYHQDPMTPVIATWDDHDYGQNDADSSFLLRDASAKTFRAFFGSEPQDGEYFDYQTAGLGTVSSTFRAGDDLFVLLDNRSARKSGDGKYNHWGQGQEAWLDETLSSAGRAWVISGNQYRGDHHMKNSVSREDPSSFARMVERVDQRAVNSLILLAGDTHMSEVQAYSTQSGKPVTEFTISPLHSRITDKHVALNNPDKPNPFRVKHPSGTDFGAMQPNFAVFAIAPALGSYTLTLIGETGEPILPPVTFAGPAAVQKLRGAGQSDL